MPARFHLIRGAAVNLGPGAPLLAVAAVMAGVELTPDTPAQLDQALELMGAPGLWALLGWLARRALARIESLEQSVDQLKARVSTLEGRRVRS